MAYNISAAAVQNEQQASREEQSNSQATETGLLQILYQFGPISNQWNLCLGKIKTQL